MHIKPDPNNLIPGSFFFSFTTGTIACDHYARDCEFGILKKKKRINNLSAVFCLN